MAERLRIARELHDVLGHHLLVDHVQASAALHRPDREPGPAQALAVINQTSRRRCDELRATLGVLRQDRTTPVEPAPGLDRLATSIDQARADPSCEIAHRGDGDPALPRRSTLRAYRIVQEALTNVDRHARCLRAVGPGPAGTATTCSWRWRTTARRRDASPGSRILGMGAGPGARRLVDHCHAAGGRLPGLRPPAAATRPAPGGGAGIIRLLLADDQTLVRAGFRSHPRR